MTISRFGTIWLATALLALGGCDAQKTAAPVAAVMPTGQQLKLAATSIAETRAVSAEVTSRDQAEARARIPGTLASLLVRAGDKVARGQAIGTVTDTRLGFETAVAGAQVVAAEAEAGRARAELARIEDLYRNSVYSKARLETAVATARAAEAQAAAARAQRSASASVAGQGVIIVPAAGRVLRADVPAGSVVSPGQSIATITAGPTVLRLMLPELLAGTLRVGSKVILETAMAGVAGGSIVQVYPAITAGQVMADAELPGLSEHFIGRRVGVRIETGRRNAIVVPRRFVTTRFGIDYVDVVAGNMISTVPVQTAPLPGADQLEILSGVGAGDTVFAATGSPGK